MRIRTLVCRMFVSLASLGIVLPQMSYAVDGRAATVAVPKALVQDVSLDPQGSLHGQLVDVNGKPLAASPVCLRQNGQAMFETRTNEEGRFSLAGVRAGVYEAASGGTTGVFRVWTAGSAPPAAGSKLLLVDMADVVRGQGGHWGQFLVVSGLIIAAGVIGGVIGYNLKDDDAS